MSIKGFKDQMSFTYLESFFEISARRFPDRIAVDDGGLTVTYQNLNERSNRIGHFLISQGVRSNDRVCFLTAKNANAYSAILGILKSGAAWVPLGMEQPAERLLHLITIIQPKIIICEDSTRDDVLVAREAAAKDATVLVLSENVQNSSQGITSEFELNDLSVAKPTVDNRIPDDLAYIIFTSGSTGGPKGVMVKHNNISQFLGLCPVLFSIEEGLRFAHHSELTFDPSLFDLFYCWMIAGTLVPFNKSSYRINPTSFVRETKVNVWFSVPTAISMIAKSGGIEESQLGSLRYLILTGEAPSGELLADLYNVLPKLKIFNVYGTTETAIISHSHEVPRDYSPSKPVPVGKVLPGFNIRLMDGDNIVPRGEIGESVVSGSQISPGYWDNEHETQDRFIRDPLDHRLPQIWYRTGDLLRINEEGLYIYVGRIDSQVKVRGFRIELEEVENAILKHKSIAEVAVVAHSPKDEPQHASLVAFTAARDKLNSEELREHIEKLLPRHMVPTRIIIDRLPLPRNTNGKIDLLALRSRAIEEEFK